MAIVEIQFQQQVFFDIIAAQVVRTEPPKVIVSQLPPGSFVERVETGQIELAIGGDIPFDDDELAVKVPVTVHVTDYQGAKAAGSLQPPVTQPHQATIWLRLEGVPPDLQSPIPQEHEPRLRFFVARLEVEGTLIPVIAPPQTIGLGDLGLKVAGVALGRGEGVISLRFFTDSASAAPAPVTNRLGTADWGQFIEGQVIADGLALELNTAAEEAAAGGGDPDIEKSSIAVGHWNGSARSAHSSVALTAVDALPADIDVPITIYATTQLALDPVQDRIELTTHISWAAHDFITELSSDAIEVVEDKVSEGILDKLKPRPGQQEIQRGDRFVVYRSYRPFMEPVTNLFRATVDGHILDDTGVGATGPVTVYPPPVAHFTLEDQHWESGVNCQARRWQTSYVPPKVHIFGVDRFHGLRILSSPTADPAGFWNPQVSWSGFGPGNQIAHVTFETPPLPPGDDGLGRVGKTSSGFIMTNLGVRWVDLGTVPARPAEPANRLGIQAYVYNRCLQLTDRWGMGVLNLDWLVDPPDLDLGMPALREWTIAGNQILEASEIELVAIGPGGERRLAAVPVERNAIFAQVITDADETLEVRSNVALAPTPPQVFQRWIIPWASTPVGADAQQLAMTDGEVLVVENQDVMRLDLQGHRGLARTSLGPSSADRFARLFRGRPDGARSLSPRTAGRGRAVAVLHRGEAVLGFAGPALRATDGLVGTEKPSAEARSEALETTT